MNLKPLTDTPVTDCAGWGCGWRGARWTDSAATDRAWNPAGHLLQRMHWSANSL